MRSVQWIVDEVIVVNIGLTASSRELFKTHGAKIIDYPRGHISEALNYGVEQATGDWVLWLHENEYLVQSAHSRLRELIYNESHDVVFLHVQETVKTTGDQTHVRVLDVARPRLFRNRIGFRFVGHLQAVTLNFEEIFQTKDDNERIQLYSACQIVGTQSFTQEQMMKQPTLLYRENELRHSMKSPWSYYELACEYFRYQKFESMLKQLNESIRLFLKNKSIPPSIYYVMKYAEVMEQPLSDNMCRGLDLALQMYPNHTDLHFYRGLIYYRRQQYKEALAVFVACTDPENLKGNYTISQGAGCYRTFYFKGKCLEKLKRLDEATQAYMDSISGMNTFAPATQSLEKLKKER
nr:glycosyltransferase [Paenibacillus faecalis]